MCKQVQVHLGYRLSLHCSGKNQKWPLIFPSTACCDNVQDWNQINGDCTYNRNHVEIINWQAWIKDFLFNLASEPRVPDPWNGRNWISIFTTKYGTLSWPAFYEYEYELKLTGEKTLIKAQIHLKLWQSTVSDWLIGWQKLARRAFFEKFGRGRKFKP